MHALIAVLAAVEESEPDKTLFYIAGGLLAVFAVVITFVGLRKTDFPASKGASRGVMGLAAVLVAFAMAAAVITG